MAANKRKILANAQKYVQKGQLDRALKEYQTLVGLDPNDSNSRLKLGDIHLRQGDKDAAADAYLKVAEKFMKDGFDAKAVAIYKQVGKIDSERIDIHEPLAELYQRLGLTSEALAALQTAADAYNREGRKRDALELLRKMATLDPTNTTSRLKIADLLRQAEMPEDALSEYEAVAEELERQGASESLIGVYERILELDPDRTPVLAAMTRMLAQHGPAERAEPFARRLAEEAPDLPDGHELLAQIHTSLGREDAAAESYRTLAEVYRRLGDDDRAREISQRVFGSEIASASDESGAGLGGDLSDLPEEEVVTPDPDLMEQTLDLAGAAEDGGFSADAEQLVAEANVYLRYGKTERAIATLDALLADEPDYRLALEKLGEAHVENGDPAKAVDLWTRAAEIAEAEENEQAAATIRERIAALDIGAAPDAPTEVAEAIGGEAAAPEVPLDAADPAPQAEEPEASSPEPMLDADDSSSDEIDLEIDLDDEMLDEDLALDAGEDAELDDDEEIELDTDVEIDDSAPDAPPEESPPIEAPAAEAPAAEAPAVEATPIGEAEKTVVQFSSAEATVMQMEPEVAQESVSGSATTPQQIAEDLEEADFYFGQGLYDEAKIIYERVLEAAPQHPQAMLRLGEIAEQQGEDPGSSASQSPALEAAAAVPEASEQDETTGASEPPVESPSEVSIEAPIAADADDEAEEIDLGDDLVDWESEDAEPDELQADAAEGAEDAALDEEGEDDLDLDMAFDADDALVAEDDTTSPELSAAAAAADSDVDTAVSVRPPETQPEIELGGLEDEPADEAADDAPEADDFDLDVAADGEFDEPSAEDSAADADVGDLALDDAAEPRGGLPDDTAPDRESLDEAISGEFDLDLELAGSTQPGPDDTAETHGTTLELTAEDVEELAAPADQADEDTQAPSADEQIRVAGEAAAEEAHEFEPLEAAAEADEASALEGDDRGADESEEAESEELVFEDAGASADAEEIAAEEARAGEPSDAVEEPAFELESEGAPGEEVAAAAAPEADEAVEEAEDAEAADTAELDDSEESEDPDELETGPAEPRPEPADAGEGGEATFDLAAELSDVFDGEGEHGSASDEADDGFEAIFREFKKGVKEQLSESDYEAHYDLGIAYREMGLLDDAVGEFETAQASPDLALPSLHMLGLCALDLERPAAAAGHFEQALGLSVIPDDQQAALRFDLGRAFESAGDVQRAREAFQAVIAIDPEYQDVADRLAALPGGEVEEPPKEEVETFESFDDLIAEAEAALGDDDGDAAEAAECGAELEAEPEVAELCEAQAVADDEADVEVEEEALEAADLAEAVAEDSEDDSEEGAAITEAPFEEPVAEAVMEAVVEPEAEADTVVEAERTQPPEMPEEAEAAEADPEPEPPEDPAPVRRRKKKISFL